MEGERLLTVADDEGEVGHGSFDLPLHFEQIAFRNVSIMFQSMQCSFDFFARDVESWSARLIAAFGDPLPIARRSPLGQLVKSIISSLTRDATSTAAYDALIMRFPDIRLLAALTPADVEPIIADVTYAGDKRVIWLAQSR